ncbi:MAG TPA: hypothetical protein DCS93_36770 [Microscillaceae bacterium]|nr:hypothetical protein [Microscillaceae bacterium]
MKNIKLILKDKDLVTAQRVEQILQNNHIEVVKASKYGVYAQVDDDTLGNYFGYVDQSSRPISIPDDLSEMVTAIYEPSPPTLFNP